VKQQFYDQIDAVVGGATGAAGWVNIPFSAANYSAAAAPDADGRRAGT
jgi:hypothetical protein